jgi:hypothetical protein
MRRRYATSKEALTPARPAVEALAGVDVMSRTLS